jgi:hypothetical protein
MGRKLDDSPEAIEKEARELEKKIQEEREETMHKVIFLCQKVGLSKEKTIYAVKRKCMVGLKEARLGVERYWKDENV